LFVSNRGGTGRSNFATASRGYVAAATIAVLVAEQTATAAIAVVTVMTTTAAGVVATAVRSETAIASRAMATMAAVTGNRAVGTHQGHADSGKEHRNTKYNDTIHLHSSV
jgi:hypothetical protein